MSGFDDFVNGFENAWQGGNKLIGGAVNGFGDMLGKMGGAYQSANDGFSGGYSPGGGSADTGAQQASSTSSVPSSLGAYSGQGMNLDNLNAMGNAATQKANQPQSLNSSVIDAVMRGISTPAIDPALMENAFSNLKSIQRPDYLAQTKDAFQRMQQQVQGMQAQINGGYDQVGTDMKDLYNTNQQAATLGNNNILQQIAQNTGNTIQGSAQGNVNALANLKNAQLASKAAVAAKGGMPMAAGDNVSDPSSVAVQSSLANAQQQAAQAGNHAMDLTNLNNEMANALGNDGAIRQQQLQNNRLGYNASVGKYMTDLTNQEAQREMDASKQNYADEMQMRSLMYNMGKDAADANTKHIAAIVGSRGLPAMLQDIGIANMDNAKAQATQTQAGNVDPAHTALQAYPQFAGAYNNALANGMGLVAGTKPTYADVYKSMINDPSVSGNGNDLVDFAQMVTSPKALQAGSPYDMLMSQFQGQ